MHRMAPLALNERLAHEIHDAFWLGFRLTSVLSLIEPSEVLR